MNNAYHSKAKTKNNKVITLVESSTNCMLVTGTQIHLTGTATKCLDTNCYRFCALGSRTEIHDEDAG